MKNTSYIKFLDFFEEHSKDFDKDVTDEAYDKLKLMVEQGIFELKEILKGALEKRNIEQVRVIIESIRREYFLEYGDSTLYELLLRTAIKFIKEQEDNTEDELMWNVSQILDIHFHQSQLVDNNPIHEELYFDLCFELVNPRFRVLLKNNGFSSYDRCLYFVMFASGIFRENKEHLKLLQPRIQWIIDNDYGKEHHFSEDWMELFSQI